MQTVDPALDRQPKVPDWLAQSASLGWRLLVVLAFGIVVLAGTAVLGTIVASVVLATAVMAAFDPLADRLRAGGRSPLMVAGLVTLAAIGLGIAVVAMAAIAFVPATAEVLRTLDAGVNRLQELVDIGAVGPSVASLISELIDVLKDWVSAAASVAVSAIASTATVALLAVFLLFFLVTDAERVIAWVLQLSRPKDRDEISRAAVTARLRLGRSLRETAVRAVVMGGVTIVIALVLGLPAPLALAFIVFVGGFIPLLGLVATTATIGFVALGTSGGAAAAIAMSVLAVATVLTPRVLRPGRWEGHGVHPALVLVALTVGAVVAGPLGLILAVPVAIVIREVVPAVIAALNGMADPGPAAGIVPRWLDRLAQWSWRLLVLVAVIAVVIIALLQVPLILVPLVIAAVLAATLAPGIGLLLRRGLNPTTASLAMTVGGFGLVLAILALTLGALIGPMQEIATESRNGAERVDDVLGSGQSIATMVEAIVPQLLAAAGVLVMALGGFVISIVLGAILTFYLLRDGRRGFDAATARLTSWRRIELEAAGARATGVLGGYMIGTGAISAAGAASQFLIMWLLGIPLAWPLAVLSFFGGFIPYIGSLLTTGLALLVTIATGSTQDALIMLIFTLVFNIVQGNIVAPLVYSRAVSIHPAIVLLAIPAGAAVAGIAGMFLAVPVIGVIATTWRTVLRVFGSAPGDSAEEDTGEVPAGSATGPSVVSPPGVVPAALVE